MQTIQYSKEYIKFTQTMQSYKDALMYYVLRLQDEFKYEKQDVIDLIRQKLSKLGPTKDYSTNYKIEVAVYLGNNRLGIVELLKNKYRYYVVITQ